MLLEMDNSAYNNKVRPTKTAETLPEPESVT